jgi:hypothetical protein
MAFDELNHSPLSVSAQTGLLGHDQNGRRSNYDANRGQETTIITKHVEWDQMIQTCLYAMQSRRLFFYPFHAIVQIISSGVSGKQLQ